MHAGSLPFRAATHVGVPLTLITSMARLIAVTDRSLRYSLVFAGLPALCRRVLHDDRPTD